MQPILTSRYAAWASRTRLYVRGLRTGTLRSFSLTTTLGLPQLRGTRRRLWVQDDTGVRVPDL